jgi:hypothetical protein
VTERPDRLDIVNGVDGIDGTESSLLDLIDNLLNQGVVISGEVVLGLAGVDLVYLRLSALLCAADKLLPHMAAEPRE